MDSKTVKAQLYNTGGVVK